jgi:hypothetical protein
MEYREIINSCYCGDGGEKLRRAEALALEFGNALSLDERIKEQLVIVKDAVLALDTHMVAMEMGKTCTVCAAKPEGGCCSAYMGHENNDALLLLMNLLADVHVKLVRDDDIECCFLAETGCIVCFR